VPIISDAIRLAAEEPDVVLTDPPPPARRIRTPRYILGLAPTPTQSIVAAVRTTAAELDSVIAEVRATARGAGYTRTVWVVGPSCRPEGLADALRARGFFPATEPPFEPEMTGMALVEAPPPGPPGIEARLVRDFEEYAQSMRLATEMMGEGDSDAGWFAAARAFWDQPDGPAHYTHVAYLDGEMVGFAWVAPAETALMLCGSYVRPDRRGRGAYRALVAARWATALRVGKPGLAIQAGAMSRPILERLGFSTLCDLHVLQDPEIKPESKAEATSP
jgi:GNAT superfamily N-acetyltransferase